MQTSADQAEESAAAREAFELLKELVQLTAERWANPGRFTALTYRWVPQGISAQVRFLIRVKGVLRNMPVQVFPDLDTRASILGALQEALDTLINEEEQQAGSQTHPLQQPLQPKR